MIAAEAVLELVAGNGDRAREIVGDLLHIEIDEAQRNPVASRTWWVGRLFGEDLAGGPEAMEAARRTLEAAHWEQSLQEPEQWVAGAAERAV
jgi:hypothetical protein